MPDSFMFTPICPQACAPSQTMYGFSPASEAELKALTLFELGYPLGAHIDVLQRGDALDITDACVTKTVFAFDGDHEQMHRVTRL